MKVVIFCHSLLSDWNHGNAHFLRGLVGELQSREVDVAVWEPADAWSLTHLLAEQGNQALQALTRTYPSLPVFRYVPGAIDLDAALEDADLVLVHEWNDPELVAAIGHHRRNHSYKLLFHDTHHRALTAPHELARYDLRDYDGLLAFSEPVRQVWLASGRVARAWTFHEAADTQVFEPLVGEPREGDLVWVGNWGDDARTAELREFLIDPVRDLGLKARVHGVRYPEAAMAELRGAGIEFGGWLGNFHVPETYARFGVTVHVPRRPHAQAPRGIPTIRVFEALACGIPLVCAPWEDSEGLFRPGRDYLVAKDGAEMRTHLRDVLNDPALAQSLVESGRASILAKHTCRHRVDELLAIHHQLSGAPRWRDWLARVHG